MISLCCSSLTKEHIYVGVDAFQFPWKAPLEMLGKAEKQ